MCFGAPFCILEWALGGALMRCMGSTSFCLIDGDTFACDIDEHSAIAGKNISIRLRGINTPELRSGNPEERKSANLEKQRLSDLLTNALVIELRNIDRDKYFRIDADVYIDGEPLLPKLNPQYLFLGKGVDK